MCGGTSTGTAGRGSPGCAPPEVRKRGERDFGAHKMSCSRNNVQYYALCRNDPTAMAIEGQVQTQQLREGSSVPSIGQMSRGAENWLTKSLLIALPMLPTPRDTDGAGVIAGVLALVKASSSPPLPRESRREEWDGLWGGSTRGAESSGSAGD